MATPEALSWEQLQARLTQIMRELPPQWSYHAKDSCTGKILRLRDIAEWCGIDRHRLYAVRRGERIQAKDLDEMQRRLTWFFDRWDRGYLEKRRDERGRWVLGYRHQEPQGHPDEAHAGTAAFEAQVSWERGTLTLKPKKDGP